MLLISISSVEFSTFMNRLDVCSIVRIVQRGENPTCCSVTRNFSFVLPISVDENAKLDRILCKRDNDEQRLQIQLWIENMSVLE